MSDTAAIELIKRAIQLDSEQKYSDALTCYSEGIRMLLKAVKGEQIGLKCVLLRTLIC